MALADPLPPIQGLQFRTVELDRLLTEMGMTFFPDWVTF